VEPCMPDVLDQVRKQYFDALYLTKVFHPYVEGLCAADVNLTDIVGVLCKVYTVTGTGDMSCPRGCTAC